jgi:hypothetical protein
LKIGLLMQEVFFFFFQKTKIYIGNLTEARGFKELDHTQYELERFGQFINMKEMSLVSVSGKTVCSF